MPDTLRAKAPPPTSALDSEFMIRRSIQLRRENARTTSDERGQVGMLNRNIENAKPGSATDQGPDDEDPGPAAA